MGAKLKHNEGFICAVDNGKRKDFNFMKINLSNIKPLPPKMIPQK
jgi:hypothetical protein